MDLRYQHMSEGPRWVDDANTDTLAHLDFESDRYDLRLGGARGVVGSDVIALVRCCVLLAHRVSDGSDLPRDQVGGPIASAGLDPLRRFGGRDRAAIFSRAGARCE